MKETDSEAIRRKKILIIIFINTDHAVSLHMKMFLFFALNKRERNGAVSHNSILADILNVSSLKHFHRVSEFADMWAHTRCPGQTVPDNEWACVGKSSSKTLKRKYQRMSNSKMHATQLTSRIPWGPQEKLTQPNILWKETYRLHLIKADNVEICSPVIL
jgi:hypothetical protein